MIESPLQIDKFAYFFEGQSYRLNRVPIKPKLEPAFHPEQSRTLDNDPWCKYEPLKNGRGRRGDDTGLSKEKRLIKQYTVRGADGQKSCSQTGSRGHRASPGKRMPRTAYGSPDATMKNCGTKKHSEPDSRNKVGAR